MHSACGTAKRSGFSMYSSSTRPGGQKKKKKKDLDLCFFHHEYLIGNAARGSRKSIQQTSDLLQLHAQCSSVKLKRNRCKKHSKLNEIVRLSEMLNIESMQLALGTFGPVPTLATNRLLLHLPGITFRCIQISSVHGADLHRRFPADLFNRAELRAMRDFCFGGDSVSVCLAC